MKRQGGRSPLHWRRWRNAENGRGLSRAPIGYSRTRAPIGGGVRPPPAICQTTGPILYPKTAFDSFGLELSEFVAKCYL